MARIFFWMLGGLLLGLILVVAGTVAAQRSRRRKEWVLVLDQETARWSAKSDQELLSELNEARAYEVAFHSKRYQVEVELLENTPAYLNVAVAVDDGTLPASIAPLTKNFTRQKRGTGAG